MTCSRCIAGAALSAVAALLLHPGAPGAHGYAGARFFPATILTDDPFVADELSLPTVSRSPKRTRSIARKFSIRATSRATWPLILTTRWRG